MKDFAKLAKAYREKHFLTQTQMAKLMGVSIATYNHLEAGKKMGIITYRKLLNLINSKEV